ILAVGDAEFRKKCEQKMLDLQSEGKTMFIVSHNAGQVKKLCERGIVLDKGQVIFDGPIDEALTRLQSVPGDLETEFPVTGEIRDYYVNNPQKYGLPVGPQQVVRGPVDGIYQPF